MRRSALLLVGGGALAAYAGLAALLPDPAPSAAPAPAGSARSAPASTAGAPPPAPRAGDHDAPGHTCDRDVRTLHAAFERATADKGRVHATRPVAALPGAPDAVAGRWNVGLRPGAFAGDALEGLCARAGVEVVRALPDLGQALVAAEADPAPALDGEPGSSAGGPSGASGAGAAPHWSWKVTRVTRSPSSGGSSTVRDTVAPGATVPR